MILRRTFKILLFVAAGCSSCCCCAMLALKLALDRAPQYQAQIKDWVYSHRLSHRLRACLAGIPLVWARALFRQLELRSQDDRRVLARAAGGRVAADIWQLLQNGKLFALRVELDAPTLVIARLGPEPLCARLGDRLGRRASSLSQIADDDDCPPARW